MAISLHIKDVIVLVVSLLGGAATGYLFYRLGVRGPRPMLQYRVISAVKIKVLGNQVELLYNGTAIPRIVELEVFFWNRGRTTLDAGFVTEADPIILRLEKDANILTAALVETTRVGSGLKIVPTSATEARIEFNFPDFRDGAMFLLVHSAAMPYPSVSGSVKGTGGDVEVVFDPFELYPEHPYGGRRSRNRNLDWLLLLFIVVDNLISANPLFPMPFSGFGLLFWAGAGAVTACKSYNEFTLRGGRIPSSRPCVPPVDSRCSRSPVQPLSEGLQQLRELLRREVGLAKDRSDCVRG